jgi:hypothetical protein
VTSISGVLESIEVIAESETRDDLLLLVHDPHVFATALNEVYDGGAHLVGMGRIVAGSCDVEGRNLPRIVVANLGYGHVEFATGLGAERLDRATLPLEIMVLWKP